MSPLGVRTQRHRAARPRSRQLLLAFPAGWGGRRKGAGRKPNGQRPGVCHRKRPVLAHRFPVHVTLRVLPHVFSLRGVRAFNAVRHALVVGRERFGMRICEFSVQGNHLHMVAEADDERCLSRGMQGFGVRLAKGLNAVMRRKGKVLADRFHARILRSPTEVRFALAYVRHNRAIHQERWNRRDGTVLEPPSTRRSEAARGSTDPFSSTAPTNAGLLPRARTYLLWQAQASARAMGRSPP